MGLEYLSYSRLSTLDKGLFKFKKKYIDGIKEEKKTEALSLGDAVDVLLTTPDDFYEKFAVFTEKSPTGQMEKYISYMWEYAKNWYSLDWENPITELHHITEWEMLLQSHEYAYSKLQDNNDEKKVKKSSILFIEDFDNQWQDYFNFFKNSLTKSILTFEEYTKAQNLANSFKNGKYTKFLFEEDLSIERHWQYEFDLVIPAIGYRVKGKIDNLDINHTEKTIKIRDIKTTGVSVLGFNSEFYSWRYDIQGVIYILAMEALFPDYVITMEYVVESSMYPNIPVFWEFPLYLLNLHMNEDFFTVGNREYKTIVRLLTELDWYEENGYDEYYESGINMGKFKLNV